MAFIKTFIPIVLVWLISLPLYASPTLTLTYAGTKEYAEDTEKPAAGVKIIMTEPDKWGDACGCYIDMTTILFTDNNGQVTLPTTSNTYTLAASLAETGDDPVDLLDAIWILQHSGELRTLTPDQLKAADVSGDGEVDLLDAIYILQHSGELRTINSSIFLDTTTGKTLSETNFNLEDTPNISVIRLGDVNQDFDPPIVAYHAPLTSGHTVINMDENMNGCVANCYFLNFIGSHSTGEVLSYFLSPVVSEENWCDPPYDWEDYSEYSLRTNNGIANLAFEEIPDIDKHVPWMPQIIKEVLICSFTGNDDAVAHRLTIHINNLDDSWVPRGDKIGTGNARDFSGNSISLSNDGKSVAIGAPGHDSDFENIGNVRVFDWNGSEWIQRGTGVDMKGLSNGSAAGHVVSLSNNGNTVAMSTPSVLVRIFDWDGNEWIQRGSEIDRGLPWTGSSWGAKNFEVSMSDDGQTIAAGSEIFDWVNSNWVKRGLGLSGEVSSISGDGNTVAIYNDEVRVYDWNNTSWVQRGLHIIGTCSSLSISSDGNTVACGDRSNCGQHLITCWYASAGQVRIFEWSGSAWLQKGTDINVPNKNSASNSGTSISISSDGNAVAIGVGVEGTVRLLNWNGNAWVEREVDCCMPIDFPNGQSVSISSDGNTLAIGSPLSTSGYAQYAGHAHVYDWGHIRTYD